MEEACNADNTARERGEPAIHKLKMLPEVVSILNRTELQSMLLDPETNFLQSVKYYMEPLNDGSLPAYNIQRDMFAVLLRLPIEKEALLSSGIGKLVLYYTKSKKPEVSIKRNAERLLGEWSRPILKRSDDYKKRKIASREFDFQFVLSITLQMLILTIPGRHNSRFASQLVCKPRKPLLPKLLVHPRRIQPRIKFSHQFRIIVTERVWRLQTPATQLLPRAPLIRIAVWTPRRARLAPVVWKSSGK